MHRVPPPEHVADDLSCHSSIHTITFSRFTEPLPPVHMFGTSYARPTRLFIQIQVDTCKSIYHSLLQGMRMTVNPRKLSSGVALCAGLALCLAGSASAQPMFQSTFPGGGSNDAARGGVLLTSDGGTISVGESQSFGTGAY